MDFCVRSNKPWALLLPNYVATKSYYTDITLSAKHCKQPPHPFFIVPTSKKTEGNTGSGSHFNSVATGGGMDTYQFEHPEGTGHDVSPFDSFWILDIFSQLSSQVLTQGKGKGKGNNGKGAPTDLIEDSIRNLKSSSTMPSPSSRVVESVDELKRLKLVPTMKRLNPKQRKKLAAKRGAGTSW